MTWLPSVIFTVSAVKNGDKPQICIKKQFLTNHIIFSTLENICLEMKFVDLW